MSTEFNEPDEIEPTARLLITGARIEPWSSGMINRDTAKYQFVLHLSRPPTPAEKIVFKEQRGEAGKEGYQLGEASARKLKLADDSHLIVGKLTAAELRRAAQSLDELIRDVERLAKERTATARADWELAGDDLKSITWTAEPAAESVGR